jgi:hypothetical protein
MNKFHARNSDRVNPPDLRHMSDAELLAEIAMLVRAIFSDRYSDEELRALADQMRADGSGSLSTRRPS